ncbi:hypothetical protein OnM2_034056 [Erysiphe neolycopersici]|uniref:Uncharacterized protein n=1 Tax=Erysiphe neolycopersici TaxID=212602 RepID=A0A420HY86_9PEZI|nr:hypothetical protein OnM2_034056 [Erysiphe neolycopersici]
MLSNLSIYLYIYILYTILRTKESSNSMILFCYQFEPNLLANRLDREQHIAFVWIRRGDLFTHANNESRFGVHRLRAGYDGDDVNQQGEGDW